MGGFDAKYKLVIVAGHAYGVFAKPDEVLNYGINHLSAEDIEFAKSQNASIKLIAQAKRINDTDIAMYVIPTLIPQDHELFHVEYENNGVMVQAAFSQRQVFIGKGAGGHPTGAAVFSDISACSYEYQYEYKKYHQSTTYKLNNESTVVKLYVSGANAQEAIEKIGLSDVEKHNNAFIGYTSTAKVLEHKAYLEDNSISLLQLS